MTHREPQQGRPALEQLARHETVLDTGSQRIAKVYAEALLRAADRRGQADEVLTELDAIVHLVFRADPHFEAFLASGAVGRKPKAEVIHRALDGKAGELVVNLLLVLNDHERLSLLSGVVAAYREERDHRAGRIQVQVTSAVPLGKEQEDRLRTELREAFHQEPVIAAAVDPALLGGMVVRVGDWLYDHSVRTRLDNLRKQIIARSSYEIQSGRNRFSSVV